MSKLGTSGSLKECERDAASGDAAAEFEETTLPLLFSAARWERTLRDNNNNNKKKEKENKRHWGGRVSLHAVQFKQGRAGLRVSLGGFQIGAMRGPDSDP